MSLLLAAAFLPLVPVAPGDERLEDKTTFVSEKAKKELVVDTVDRVMCLERRGATTICLTESEWKKTIALAETKPKNKARAFIPSSDNGIGTGSSATMFGRPR